jgi:hypothetical protein
MESLPLMIRAAIVPVFAVLAVLAFALGRRRKQSHTDLGLWAPAPSPQRRVSGSASQVQ